jgi:hypothetical protein
MSSYLYANQYISSREVIATVDCTASYSLLSSPSAQLPVTSIRPVTAGIQSVVPSLITLYFRGNFLPIGVNRVSLKVELQATPSTPSGRESSTAASLLLVTTLQELPPSVTTLFLRSTRNECGNCTPILATVRLYCLLQLTVFDC